MMRPNGSAVPTMTILRFRETKSDNGLVTVVDKCLSGYITQDGFKMVGYSMKRKVTPASDADTTPRNPLKHSA